MEVNLDMGGGREGERRKKQPAEGKESHDVGRNAWRLSKMKSLF